MSGSRAARFVGSLLAEAFYRTVRPVMWAGIAAHFRRVTVVSRERFPRRGALLLVSNHPSTWSDVLLLYGMLGRRFHFLAEPGQFHPWPRALLIRSFGTLPVYLSESGRDAIERNETTFRRCRALLDRGEAVAIFPEGISWVDRSLVPLRRGAARLALSYACARGGNSSFTLVPVALRYSDRVAFRSEATLSVGEPIARPELEAEYGSPDASEVERLTERVSEALRRLGPLARDPREGRLLGVLESVAAARDAHRGPETAAILLGAIAALERESPRGHARLARLAHAHARGLRALRVSDAALADPAPRTARRTALRAATLGMTAIPALAGIAIHAGPVIVTRIALHGMAYGPSQVAFARITSGFFCTVGTYFVLALLLATRFQSPPAVIAAALAACASLGAIAIAWWDRIHPILERWRVRRIARRHPRLVAAARRSQEILNTWIHSAHRDSRGER